MTAPSDLGKLLEVLRQKVPNGNLKSQQLYSVAEIQLLLIEDTYPQEQLTSEQVEQLMDSPPYWAFCWASGQVMARFLIDNPEVVRGKTIVDFGCGSGVVAIAAAIAGADAVIALDIDPGALLASQMNARLNDTNIIVSDNLDSLNVDKKQATLLIADVFYDEDNIPLLTGFLEEYDDVIVADSRVKPSKLKGLKQVYQKKSSTVPDLGESASFNKVTIYRN